MQLLVNFDCLGSSHFTEIFSVRNGEFSVYQKLYATEIKVDYSDHVSAVQTIVQCCQQPAHIVSHQAHISQ